MFREVTGGNIIIVIACGSVCGPQIIDGTRQGHGLAAHAKPLPIPRLVMMSQQMWGSGSI